MIPVAKFIALYYLVWSVEQRPFADLRQRTKLYLIAEFIGKWSMIDVFVVAILVALVHVGELLVIRPGIAAYSFAGVVIVTMLAAECFDPRLMWDKLENSDDSSAT
jgi:paraquat-inducible protein A